MLELYGTDHPDAVSPSLPPKSKKKLLVDTLILLRMDVFENVEGAKLSAENTAAAVGTSHST